MSALLEQGSGRRCNDNIVLLQECVNRIQNEFVVRQPATCSSTPVLKEVDENSAAAWIINDTSITERGILVVEVDRCD